MKKVLSFALALLMLVSAISVASAETVTTIKWWAFPTFAQPEGAAAGTYEASIVEAFEAANPGIKVEVETIDFQNGPEKLVSAMEAGTGPDVIFDAPGRLVEYGKNGKMVQLNDLFTDELKADVNNDALIEACEDGTNYWMYPISTSPFYMGLNREQFEKSGAIEFVNLEGDRTWTVENFLKALDKLHEAGYKGGSIYCGGQGGDQGTRALVSNLFGATIANPERTEYTMNSEEGKKALELLKQLVDEGKLEAGVDIVAGDELQLFQQGILSMSFCYGTTISKQHKAAGFNAIAVPFPSQDGTPKLEYLVNGFGIVNNNDEARAEAAKKFVQWVCDDAEWGPKNVLQTGAFPVRTSYGNLYEGDEEYELLAKFTNYYAPYYNTMDNFAKMRKEWWTMLQAVLTGEKDIDSALATYSEISNAK